MKTRTFLTIIFIVLILLSGTVSSQEDSKASLDFPVIKGNYLGQVPPNLEPLKFAEGVISLKNTDEGCSGFLLNETVFIFQRFDESKFKGHTIYEMVLTNGIWTKPKELAFSTEYKIGDFTIAPDGKTMYFESKQEIPEIENGIPGGNIFKIERTIKGWGNPEHLGFEVNTKNYESYPCVSRDGTLYFFSDKPDGFGKFDLYTAKLLKGKYINVTNMGDNFNSRENEWDPFIAPDESYIIFCSTKDRENGLDDLYISFKNIDESWTSPLNMGDKFNSVQSENRPYVTQDGKYLFYTSMKDGTRDIYWVDAKIIETMKLTNTK